MAIRRFGWMGSTLLIGWVACSPAQRGAGEYRIALVPSRSGQHGIFVMRSDTSGGKLLTPDVSAQLRSNSWSPDGKKIAFLTVRSADFEMLSQYRMPNHSPLYVMDAIGTNQRRLLDYPVSDFGWSPDSRQLFFISAYENPERNDPAVQRGAKTPLAAIYVYSSETGQQRRITGFGQGCSAAWSPDGTRLAVSFGSSENSGIYSTIPDGQQGIRLTDSATIDLRPAWSPDGKKIAYVAVARTVADQPNAGVFIINADGSNKSRLSDKAAYAVAWSTDGSTLLLQYAGGMDLISPDGKQQRQLQEGDERPLDAVFTPDGQGVMFRSKHESDWNLYFVDLKGANRRRLTGQLTASQFCLSPLLSNR